MEIYTEGYRSGHNGADSKSVVRLIPDQGFESLTLRHRKACNQADCRLFSYVFFKSKWSEHTAFFALLNLDFAILPSAPEIAAFGQSKPCFHRLCRGDFGAVIKVRIDICRHGKIAVPKPLLNVLQRYAVCKKQACTTVP